MFCKPIQSAKRKVARTLYEIQDGMCALCQGPMAHPDDVRACGLSLDQDAPTLDHFLPKSMGGPWMIWNLMLAHRRCNEARGNGPVPTHTLAVHEKIFSLTRDASPS